MKPDKWKWITVEAFKIFANDILKFIKNILWIKIEPDEKIKNICIYKLGNVGDLLCAIPSFYKIRQHYPDAKITLLTSPGEKGAIGAKAVLACVHFIDEIEEYYAEDISSIQKIISFLKRHRGKQYDYLIQLPAEATSFKTQLRNLLFFKCMKIKRADGFYISTINLFAKAQERYSVSPNESQRLINGLPFKDNLPIEFPIEISAEDKKYVDLVLEQNDIINKDRLMMISHTGKAQANLWSLDRFGDISKRWISKGGKTVIIGGRGEFEKGQQIVEWHEPGTFNLCGKFTLSQSMYLLTKAHFLLTIDTGTVHMASAMNVPCITLSASNYFSKKWDGYGSNNLVYRKELNCSLCLKKICKYGDNRCMNAITTDEVWEYILHEYID